MDFSKLLTEGAVNLAWEGFQQLARYVVGWLVETRRIQPDDDELATEVLEDLINIHVATGGLDGIRKDIVWRAATSSDPNQACLKGLREAVWRGVNRRRYADYRKRLYRRVKLSVIELERKELLQSWNSNRGSERPGADSWNWNRGSKRPGAKSRSMNRRSKKVGLKSWGPLWLKRIPKMSLSEVERHLPVIPCYEGEHVKGNETDRQNESKIFDSSLLLPFIPMVCELYGGPLTISELAAVVERKLSRPLYRFDRQTLLPSIKEDDRTGTFQMANPRDLLACSESSWEEEILDKDVRATLEKDLTPDDIRILEGLEEGKSKRALAKLCNCAPNTLEKRRQALARKAARHDPCIRARLRQLETEAQREKNTSGKKQT